MADSSTIARPYAKAVFAIARESGELAAWSQALACAAAVVGDPQAREYLARPVLGAAERAGFVQSILAKTSARDVFSSPAGKNLLAVLSESGRLPAVPEIALQFEKLKALAENKIRVRLVSANAVDSQQVRKVAEALRRRLGLDVEVDVEIDPALVGGAVVRADDKVIDGSVRSRLQRLAGSLIG
jgi:F-type H+-transporting ATPase subunit delta